MSTLVMLFQIEREEREREEEEERRRQRGEEWEEQEDAIGNTFIRIFRNIGIFHIFLCACKWRSEA